MRHHQSTVTPADIQCRVMSELSRLLPWVPIGPRCAVDLTLRIRHSLASQLPDLVTLADAFSQRFRALIPHTPRKGFVIAIDTHWCCYYGNRSTRGIVHGQRKAGTRRFFVYATAVIVEKGRRYTLALTAAESNRPLEALRPLLDQIAATGIGVRMLLLDKGFYATAPSSPLPPPLPGLSRHHLHTPHPTPKR